MSKNIKNITKENGISEIKLFRPHRLNAITLDLLEELKCLLDDLINNIDVKVIIITGEGISFSAGVDLKELENSGVDISIGGVGEKFDSAAHNVINLMQNSSKPIISKINGYCFTGGLEIAMSADIIYASSKAKIGDTHAVLGFRPSWGLSQRLPLLVGIQRAKELSYTAKTITGKEAKEYGLVLDVFEPEELDSKVDEIATNISKNSSNSIKAYKDLYRIAMNKGLQDGINYENSSSYHIPEVKERLRTFLKKLK